MDGMVMNEQEAELLTGQTNLVRAGLDIMRRGPRYVVVKKGEHGALLFCSEGIFALLLTGDLPTGEEVAFPEDP